MDIKDTYPGPKAQWIIGVTLNELKLFKPDMLFVTDDDALRDIAVYHTNTSNDGLPVVFTGINIRPEVNYAAYIGNLSAPNGVITGKY